MVGGENRYLGNSSPHMFVHYSARPKFVASFQRFFFASTAPKDQERRVVTVIMNVLEEKVAASPGP